ncbi:hypothetical protein FACS1894113_5270 [Alphaproteobacteria bacterium]|nr:hypothetical protein FACS1894113_5270 [Alphaproteobacteria bacterium]
MLTITFKNYFIKNIEDKVFTEPYRTRYFYNIEIVELEVYQLENILI